MSHQQRFVGAIAEILLLGEWTPQEMLQRVCWLLEDQPVWLKPLLARVHKHFNLLSTELNSQDIIRFITHDQQFIENWSQQRHMLHVRRYNLEQVPALPATLLCPVPALKNLKELSLWLGISYAQLESFAANWRTDRHAGVSKYEHYHYHWRTKPGGRQRLIEAPKQRLAAVQRQVYLGILAHVPVHENCHGFQRGRSCRTYVLPHAGKQVVLHMDLANFFISIPYRRIHALFTCLGYNATITRRLAGLCCHQTPLDIVEKNAHLTWLERQQMKTPHLTQGSPSSPVLANLCAYKLDLRLTALADKIGANYTRYADDLAFSGDQVFVQIVGHLPALVSHIAATEGFSINHRKTKIMGQGSRQSLTGITVNKFPNCARKDYDQLKAILYNCVKHGPQSQNKRQHLHFRAHLQGCIAQVRSLNFARAKKLQCLFEKIDWLA